MNNLKIKVGDLDVGKLKYITVDLKKLSDAVYNKVVLPVFPVYSTNVRISPENFIWLFCHTDVIFQVCT